jgi:hypothetical protein
MTISDDRHSRRNRVVELWQQVGVDDQRRGAPNGSDRTFAN